MFFHLTHGSDTLRPDPICSSSTDEARTTSGGDLGAEQTQGRRRGSFSCLQQGERLRALLRQTSPLLRSGVTRVVEQ